MKFFASFFSFVFIVCLAFASQGQSQPSDQEAVNIFLDCGRCSQSFIRQEITYINYVRDKEDADVHVLITRQGTGSGGTEYTIRYLGRKDFEGVDDTMTYTSAESDTDDEERRGLVRVLKVGIFPYVTKFTNLQNFNISYNKSDEGEDGKSQDDKWNYWVFELSGRGSYSGEETRKDLYVSFGGSADRVTPDWKINLYYDYDLNRRKFIEKDSTGQKDIDIFTTRGQRFDGTVVKSLNEHWSVGVFGEAFTSSRNNLEYAISGSPAIEYNIFPYEEYSTHEISFQYLIKSRYNEYEELTIFNETSEFLVQQELRTRMDFTQPWGEIEGRLNASTYMHDLSKNRVDFDLELDFRVFRGLSLSINGRYSLINDQLSIPKGNISDAEQLLNLREQATSYSYYISAGIEYTFGSIYNNVVNPRF
jgi:hypothetical protein